MVSLRIFVLSILSTLILSCTLRKKDIIYTGFSQDRNNILDVYYPKNKKGKKDVIVFIHGGSWNSGDKKLYWWLGRNFASKNIVTIVINYPLYPDYQYEDMATNSAKAVKWVYENIKDFRGNPERIFLMGHSAGGHLAALISEDDTYFKEVNLRNPVKGIILNDPFGLDMYKYLSENRSGSYLKTFSNDPEVWKKASPQYHLKESNIPYLIFTGEKTYQSIKDQANNFSDKLKENGTEVNLQEIKNKKHIGMITQMLFRWNKHYKEIENFIDGV